MNIEEFIEQHKDDDTSRLLLDAKRYVGVDVPFAVVQIEGYRRLASKLPEWVEKRVEIPCRLATEQCSSEQTARYKRQLVRGKTLADLTGGYGVDCYYMGCGLDHVVYVERDTALFGTVQRNYSRLGYAAEMFNDDGEQVLHNMPRVDTLFLDPARRDTKGRKMVGLEDCEPNVLTLLPLLRKKCSRLIMKLSPMIDVKELLRQVPQVSEIYILAVRGECKEVVAVCDWVDGEDVRMKAVNFGISTTEVLSFWRNEEEGSRVGLAEKMGHFLYEPNAAVLKSGAFKLLCDRYAVNKLHINTHLYTSDVLVADFPGKTFVVEAVGDFSKKSVRELLSGVESANLVVRNFPEPVAVLQKRLRLRDGGDVYLYACTIWTNEKKIVKCRRLLS